MIYSNDSLITVGQIKAEVMLRLTDDDGKMFTPGKYVSWIQKALSELSFDTEFFELTHDEEFPSESLSLKVPKGCFNLRELYLMNKDVNGTISNVKNVFLKEDYNTKGEGTNYTSKMMPSGTDTESSDYYTSGTTDRYYPDAVASTSRIYWYSMNNGFIQFSSTCSGFSHVRMVFNGTFTDIGDVPFIPEMFREAVEGYVEEKALRILKARSPRKWRSLWNDAYQILYDQRNGTWRNALVRGRKLDKKPLKDFLLYQQRMNY